jgi:fatty acid desaturase
MDAVLSLLISAGIIAFGVWVVAATITAGWPWTLIGLLAVIVGLLSLYKSVQEAKTRRF